MNKLKTLQAQFKKEFNKYNRAMSYRLASVEIDALYNVLVLKKASIYELTRRHEANVRDVLSR